MSFKKYYLFQFSTLTCCFIFMSQRDIKSSIPSFNDTLPHFRFLLSELKLLINPMEVVIISYFVLTFKWANLVYKAAPQICSCTITTKGHFSGGSCLKKIKIKKIQRGRARSFWPGKQVEGKARSNVPRMPVYM